MLEYSKICINLLRIELPTFEIVDAKTTFHSIFSAICNQLPSGNHFASLACDNKFLPFENLTISDEVRYISSV